MSEREHLNDEGRLSLTPESAVELQNRQAVQKIRALVSRLSSASRVPVQQWCDSILTDKSGAQLTGVPWNELQGIVEQTPADQHILTAGCQEFGEFLSKVEKNLITTPPEGASTVPPPRSSERDLQAGIARQARGIYGKNASPTPPASAVKSGGDKEK